jgi:hypothetical protein
VDFLRHNLLKIIGAGTPPVNGQSSEKSRLTPVDLPPLFII